MRPARTRRKWQSASRLFARILNEVIVAFMCADASHELARRSLSPGLLWVAHALDCACPELRGCTDYPGVCLYGSFCIPDQCARFRYHPIWTATAFTGVQE